MACEVNLALQELIQYVLHVTIPVVRHSDAPPLYSTVSSTDNYYKILTMLIFLPLPTALNDAGTGMIEVNS